jgi:hypothetical protein
MQYCTEEEAVVEAVSLAFNDLVGSCPENAASDDDEESDCDMDGILYDFEEELAGVTG